MISGNETISNHQSDYSDKVSQDQSDRMPGQQLEQKPKSWLNRFNRLFQSEGGKKQSKSIYSNASLHQKESDYIALMKLSECKPISVDAGRNEMLYTPDDLTTESDEFEDEMNEHSDDPESDIGDVFDLMAGMDRASSRSECREDVIEREVLLNAEVDRASNMSENRIKRDAFLRARLVNQPIEDDIERPAVVKAKILSDNYLIKCDVLFKITILSEIVIIEPGLLKNVVVRGINRRNARVLVRMNDSIYWGIMNVLRQHLVFVTNQTMPSASTLSSIKRRVVYAVLHRNLLAIDEESNDVPTPASTNSTILDSSSCESLLEESEPLLEEKTKSVSVNQKARSFWKTMKKK